MKTIFPQTLSTDGTYSLDDVLRVEVVVVVELLLRDGGQDGLHGPMGQRVEAGGCGLVQQRVGDGLHPL